MFARALRLLIVVSGFTASFVLVDHVKVCAQPSRGATSWTFTYFAGDPPVWRTQPDVYTTKAECEIARAEKTAAGYPVGDCAKSIDEDTIKASPSPQTPEGSDEVARVKARRAKKLRQGCEVACDTERVTCEANVLAVTPCVQEQNARCIKRCTTLEGLPHHQCINEVCLPSDINVASWQGLCETKAETAKARCDTTHITCISSCKSAHPVADTP